MRCKTPFQKGVGGMVAVLGSEIEIIKKIIDKKIKINMNVLLRMIIL